MSSKIKAITRDLDYQEYQERQYLHVSPDQIREDSQRIVPTDRFQLNEQGWQPTPYRGYALLSMVEGAGSNNSVFTYLTQLQGRLASRLNASSIYYMLPPDSFHQTIANTLSAHRFQKHIVDKGLTEKYPIFIQDAIKSMDSSTSDSSIKMKLIGLSIFRTAMGILGVFDQQSDYERILKFRNNIYSNTELNELDVKWTRPFIGHITFSYIGRNLGDKEKGHLVNTLIELNEEVTTNMPVFDIEKVELRNYEHLAKFNFYTGDPSYYFIKHSGDR